MMNSMSNKLLGLGFTNNKIKPLLVQIDDNCMLLKRIK